MPILNIKNEGKQRGSRICPRVILAGGPRQRPKTLEFTSCALIQFLIQCFKMHQEKSLLNNTLIAKNSTYQEQDQNQKEEQRMKDKKHCVGHLKLM